MRGLVYVIGTMEDIFFKQEIDYFKEFFDKIVVLSIEEERVKANKIADEIGVAFRVLPRGVSFKQILSLLNLFCKADIREEIRGQLGKAYFLKRFAYIGLYGVTAVKAVPICQELLNDELSDCDEIYSYSFYLSRGAFILTWLKKENIIKFKKLVARGHGYDLYEERNDIKYLPLRGFIFEHIDDISLISKDGYNYFFEKYKNHTGKARLYYLGTKNPKGLKKKIIYKKKLTIASCSLIVKVKRLDLIIELLSLISDRVYVEINWIHLGAGELMEEMITLAKEKLLKVKFNFLGQIQNDKVLDVLLENDADYLINMSDSEGLPVSMMEAFSLGIPVIARDVGGVHEIVNQNCGLLIENTIPFGQESIEKIEDYLCLRLNDIKAYTEESHRCVEKWQNLFNAEKNHRAFIKDIVL